MRKASMLFFALLIVWSFSACSRAAIKSDGSQTETEHADYITHTEYPTQAASPAPSPSAAEQNMPAASNASITPPENNSGKVVPLQFYTAALDYEEAPVLDETQVSGVFSERDIDGMNQVVYRRTGDNINYYTYLTVNGIDYDLGFFRVGSVSDDSFEFCGLNKAAVPGDITIYMMIRDHGVDYASTAYYGIIGGIPDLIYEIEGSGSAVQLDLDGDGVNETIVNAGGSTSDAHYVIYEWDLENGKMQYADPQKTLNCRMFNYNDAENLFYAEYMTSEQPPVTWDEFIYEYKNGALLLVDADN